MPERPPSPRISTAHAATAAAAPPTEASIDRLLALTRAKKTMDAMAMSIDKMMHSSIPKLFGGKQPTPAQVHAIDGLVTDYVKIIREELSFAAMHQTYLTIYREAFTQQEIDGMLAFYDTPAGRALIDKTPFVMQRTLELMQARIGPIVQKFQESVRKASAELKAAGDNPATDEKPAAEDAPK